MSDNEQGQPKSNNKNEERSQNLYNGEANAFNERQLANETIEQEAEVSGHTKASDIDVIDASEPAAAGQPKSIANDELHL